MLLYGKKILFFLVYFCIIEKYFKMMIDSGLEYFFNKIKGPTLILFGGHLFDAKRLGRYLVLADEKC